MERLFNTGIKQIIDENPPVGTILEAYGIGCVPCAVGTCMLKDIVEIHNLSAEGEQEMMARIAEVVYPGQTVEIPLRKRQVHDPGAYSYSPPIRKLVDEHTWIKRVLAEIPKLALRIDLEREEDRQDVLDCLDFIRNYADKFHHAKEEAILFKLFDEGLDIIKVILTDHDTGRGYVASVATGVENRNVEAVRAGLSSYRELLTEHIKKEDEILYPWIDRQLSDHQVGRLFSEFSEVDVEFGDAPRSHEVFVIELEKKA
jgi:hemerythrin-like domain-containing protein